MKSLRSISVVLATATVVALSAAPAPAATSPWHAGSAVRQNLFDARSEVAFGERSAARRAVLKARRSYARSLKSQLRRVDRSAAARAEDGLDQAAAGVRSGSATAVAEGQAKTWAALLAGAAAAAAAAAEVGDASETQRWLLLRDFRTATRFTRPGTDATEAVDLLKQKKLAPSAAALAIRKDLLDTYQARERELEADVQIAIERNFRAKAVESAAQAVGYWEILRSRYREDLGPTRLRAADAAFSQWSAAVSSGDRERTAAARVKINKALDGFVAAPFTAREEARRAQQLFRFIDLIPFEYETGVKDGRVTKDIEIQEAIGFRDGAEAAFGDLKGKLERRNPERTAAVAAGLAKLSAVLANAQQKTTVASTSEVQRLADQTASTLRAEAPKAWSAKTDESEFDLIKLTLERMDAEINQGQWAQAEQARLEAYAFLEFGPELKLRAFDPNLATELEGLIWFGAQGKKGLAQLIANRDDRTVVRPTRVALTESLNTAQATLGESQSTATAVVNGAILVFREGLEAVLILAAITASMVGILARRKRAVMVGAALGLVLSIVTWGVAQLVIDQFSRYGEKVEAVVGIFAIAVLLYVMNWFFHKVYWTEHIRKFHDRRRKLVGEKDGSGSSEGEARIAFWSAQAVGFALLGLSSVYREGLETVLFLQSLQLATDTKTVVMGALLGLTVTFGVAVVTFRLQRKLPYKRMLIATGMLLALVLFVMVGNTVRSMQGIGWMPVTPIDVEPPLWAGTWLGIFPSWQSIGAQVAAVTIVIGSYFLAEEIRVKRPQRQALRRQRLQSQEAEA